MNILVEPEVHDVFARIPGFGFVQTFYSQDTRCSSFRHYLFPLGLFNFQFGDLLTYYVSLLQ